MSSEILANIPLFRDLTPEQREELSRSLTQQNFPAGQPIFWVSDPGTSFYIVRSGRVALSAPDDTGQDLTLAELGPGQFFGELSLLDGGRRTATARAITDSTLLSLDRTEFNQFLLKHPVTMLQIIAELSRRQRDMVDKLRGVANVNQVIKEHTTHWMRIADAIATVSASREFVLIHIVAVVLWVGFNLIRGKDGPDPYPFQFMAMFASLEAIFLSIFVLISQNRQSDKDRIRADLDYQVNVKAHVEVMQLHHKIDELKKIVEQEREKDAV